MRLSNRLLLFIVPASAAIVSLGCILTDCSVYSVSHPNLDSVRVSAKIDALNRVANDRTAMARKRTDAVMELFAEYIRVGYRPSDIHRVLRDTSWLTEVEIDPYSCDFGWDYIPIKATREDQTYVLHLFSNESQKGHSIIIFRLGRPLSGPDKALEFLRGKEEADGGPVLKEFSLCNEDGTFRRFCEDGKRVLELKR